MPVHFFQGLRVHREDLVDQFGPLVIGQGFRHLGNVFVHLLDIVRGEEARALQVHLMLVELHVLVHHVSRVVRGEVVVHLPLQGRIGLDLELQEILQQQ